MGDEVLELDALAQAERVRTGELGCAELVELAIRRIDARNPLLNCVVVERFEAALDDARALDKDRGAAPLAGVPILLKDLGQEVEGLIQTDGSRAERRVAAARDSALTQRYREAGLVVLGKTSSPEFGNHSTSEPLAHGPCRNPWNTSRTSGGSSGGSAAAVAARLVAIGGASDGAGSIRIPASCCGVFGLKPSRGRIATTRGVRESLSGLAVSHAITRTVRDSAMLLDLASAAPSRSRGHLPIATDSFLSEVGADPGRRRIAVWSSHLTGGDVDAECVRAVERTAECLAVRGHRVEVASPDFDVEAITHNMLDVWAMGNATARDAIVTALGRPLERDELEPTTWELIEHAERLTDTKLAATHAAIEAAATRIAAFFDAYDLWLTPTLATPPPPLGELNRSVGSASGWWTYDLAFNPWCPVANVAGSPAASLPLDISQDGLPIGVMLTAGFGQEALLLRVCAQLEKAIPWSAREPNLSPV